MKILERIFDKVLVPESPEQADSRSTMRGFFRADEAGLLLDFAIRGHQFLQFCPPESSKSQSRRQKFSPAETRIVSAEENFMD